MEKTAGSNEKWIGRHFLESEVLIKKTGFCEHLKRGFTSTDEEKAFRV